MGVAQRPVQGMLKRPRDVADRLFSRFLKDERRALEVSRVIPGAPKVVEERLRTRLMELGLVRMKDVRGAEGFDEFKSPMTFLRFGNPSRLRRALDMATIRSVAMVVEEENRSPRQSRVTLRCALQAERLASVVGGASLSGTLGGLIGGGFVTLSASSVGVLGAMAGLTLFAAGSVIAGLPIPGFRAYRSWTHRQAEEALEEVLEELPETHLI